MHWNQPKDLVADQPAQGELSLDRRGKMAKSQPERRPQRPMRCAPRRSLIVMHVITDLTVVGGAEQMLLKLAQVLPGLGVEMCVVSLGGRGELGAEIESAGVPVRSLRARSLRHLPAAVLALAREIRARDPDIVQTWLYHGDFIGTISNALAGLRTLVWNIRCSDIDLDLDNKNTAWIRWMLARASAVPNLVIANSRAGLDAHHALGYRPRSELIIPNGFDGSAFRPDPVARVRIRAELCVGPDQPLIGMAARVAPMKDHESFLQAARELAQQRGNVVFALAGAGTEPHSPLAGRAAALGLDGRVRMLGKRADMAQVFAAFDVATLSSAHGEGFPNVLGEAMSCGIPCVATDVGDAAIIIRDTGCIVPPRAPQALAEAWRNMIDLDVNARRTLGLAARAHISQHYEITRVARQYLETYQRLAAPNGGVPVHF
jgi:glycosyltransferase involved in cell wall biosynthesis